MERAKRQESDESPIFSILPEISDDVSRPSFASSVDWSQSTTHTNNFHNMSSSNGINFEFSGIPTTHQSIVPANLQAKEATTSTAGNTSTRIPEKETTSNVSLTTAVEHNRQLLILALLEQVAALNDATPRTFALHVMHLLENQIIEPSTVRHLFDYHGLIPKHMKGDHPKAEAGPPKNSNEFNNALTMKPLQQEREVQLALLRQYFLSQPTSTTKTSAGSQNVPKGPQSIHINQMKLQLHPNIFSLQRHPLLTSRCQRDFHHISYLSSGSFGSVHHVQNKLDTVEYALKQIYFHNKGFEQHTVDLVLREVKCLAQLNHKHCVRYYTSWLEPSWNSSNRQNGHQNGAGINQNNLGQTRNLLALTDYPNNALADVIKDMDKIGLVEQNQIAIIEKLSSSPNQQDFDYSVGDEQSISIGGYGDDSDYSEWSENVKGDNSEWTDDARGRTSSSGDGKDQNQRPVNQQKQKQTKTSDASTFHYQICLYIQMELCKPTTLLDWINHRNNCYRKENEHDIEFHKARLDFALSIMEQISSGLEHVHSKNIVHRDLKPANIFSCKNTPNVFKIGDFGLSKSMKPPSKMGRSNEAGFTTTDMDVDIDVGLKAKNTLGIGTASYSSPEQMCSSNYGPPSDIFSLGLICLELVGNYNTGHLRARAFDSIRKSRKVLLFLSSHFDKNGKNNNCMQVASALEILKDLILVMTEEDPSKRPSSSLVSKSIQNAKKSLQRKHQKNAEDISKVQLLEKELGVKNAIIREQSLKIEEMEQTITFLKNQLETNQEKCYKSIS